MTNTTKPADKRVLKRISDLYAMSQDSSSPNEAAIAARRCRALMDEHQIQQSDLEQSDFLETLCAENMKRILGWMQHLMIAVATVNDCQARRTDSNSVVFSGLEHDALSASLMMKYLTQALERQWSLHRKDLPRTANVRTTGTDFRQGFSHAVADRLKSMLVERNELCASDGRSLIVVKSKLIEERYGKPGYSSRRKYQRQNGHFEAGTNAGNSLSLNQQVSTTRSTPQLS